MFEMMKKSAIGCSIALVLLAAIELALWTVGVVPLSDRIDPYVGFSNYLPLYESRTVAGRSVRQTSLNKLQWFNHQSFADPKPSNVTRVFCLGGSTTYGRPYDDQTSFCGWLRELLPSVDPDRRWEVVNAGGISYASYRVARLMEELSAYQPDLFIVYTGHNEFLEQRTYGKILETPESVRDVGALFSRTRLFSSMYDAVDDDREKLSGEVQTLLDRSVGPDAYHRNDAHRMTVLNHFRDSLRRMKRLADRAGAGMVLVTPASNVADFSPFKSEYGPGLTSEAISRVDSLMVLAGTALAEGRGSEAVALSREAVSLDPRYADGHFAYARSLQAIGNAAEARAAYFRARDEDICPLRAPAEVVSAVAEVARATGTPLVDFDRIIVDRSSDGIPGAGLFLDHVHPTIEGNRILALAIIDRLIEDGVVDAGPDWGDSAIQDVIARVEGNLDERSHETALKNLSRLLLWAGKHEEAERVVGLLSDHSAADGEALFQKATLARRSGDHRLALTHYREAILMSPGRAEIYQAYGSLLSELGRKTEAMAELEKAIHLNPGLAEAHYDLGIVLKDMGDLSRAEAAYRNTLRLDPRHVDARNNLGVLLARQGDIRAAAEQFREALRIDPGHTGAAANLSGAQGRTVR